MSDLRQTLNQVLAGTKPPAEFLKAVDSFLAQPNANVTALRTLIDAAEQLGLPHETAQAARARLPQSVGAGAEATEVLFPDATRADIGEPTRVTDDEAEKTVLTTGDAKTNLRADPADAGDSERTVVTGDGDRTVVTGDIRRVAGGDPDKTEITGDAEATVQVGGDDPFAMTHTPAASSGKPELGPGSVLKQRFRLEEVIGQGGMGAVYKAVDLLKVEARDRNPYMAVKLLVGDFKEHPEAFIALQRESAKAQRLAHPNIATVYDFDRDGETVYMTMELMVGAELAKYIKKLPAGGLPVPDAMKIIEQLCAGLQYAHARGLVHSDFKPGNAFLLDDGTVKLLDFGIARASKTKGDAEGESTVFDPGQLGALTPAYATIEMFEGQDPDPRDDIYALAAVAYELFTGKHPFNKMSAVKAKEKNLKVAPVDKLTKRQNRTLMKALALHRADRTPSVEEFWEGLKPRKDYTLQIAGGSLAAILLIGFLAYQPVLNAIHNREHNEIVAEIDSGDDTRLVAALERIDVLEPPERKRVVAERAQARIFDYFESRAAEVANVEAQRYDFPAALVEVDQLERYFPGTAAVLQLRQRFESERATLVGALAAEFETLLEDERVLPDPDARDVTDILDVLRVAQPDSALIRDARLESAYTRLADAQIDRSQWQRANDILAVALRYQPDAPALLDRNDRVASELRRERETALVASLRDQLRTANPQTLEAFRAAREPLQQLGELRPADPAVRSLDARLRTAVERGIADAAAANDWAAADALLAEFARTLPLDALIAMRASLTERQVAAGYVPADAAARTADLAQRTAAVRQLLAQPSFDDEFERALTGQFKEITARLGADTVAWDTLRDEIANAHIARARELVAGNRFLVARELLDQGRRFHPELAAFAAEGETLAAAERAYEAEQARLQQVAAIDAGKARFRNRLEQGDVGGAQTELTALRRALPANDPFLVTDAPRELGAAYVAAVNQAGTTNAATAATLAEAGLRALPGHPELTELQTRFRQLQAQQQVVTDAGRVTTANFAAFQRAYTGARQGLAGNAATAFDNAVVNALATRLTALDTAGEYSAANSLRDSALDVFQGNQRLTQLNLRQPSQFAARVQTEIEAGRLTRAREVLEEGRRVERDHPDLRGVGDRLTARERDANAQYTAAREALARNDRAGAQRSLAEAMRLWTDNETFTDFNRQFAGTMAPARADDGSVPCSVSLAGHGARGARAACFDMVAGERAPQLVVVPAPAGGQPFAVGKYEVSVAEYNHFCRSGGGCQPLAGEATHPATGVSIQNVDAYIAWLAQTTGKQYRLPTDAEWLHAASMAGQTDGRDGANNCRVTQGGNVIKGLALTAVSSGPANRWGLSNIVGNAQEFVRNGGSLQARGGAFEDSLTNCEVALTKPHGGGADGLTGFRVVRPID